MDRSTGRRSSVVLKAAWRDERGITGLETAIILIAFVVVASVFAYTVLTAGIFASQKSNEAVNAAIQEVRSTIIPSGKFIAYSGDVDIDGDTNTVDTVEAVVRISIDIAVALKGVPVDLTPSYELDPTNGNLRSSGLRNTLVIDWLDRNQVIKDLAWTAEFSGDNDGDFSLEPTERGTVILWLVEYEYDDVRGLYYTLGAGPSDPFIDTEEGLLGRYQTFSVSVSPVQGAPLQMERTVPQSLNEIMDLH